MRGCPITICGLAALLGWGNESFAEEFSTPRDEMHSFYREQASQALSLFASPPMGHVIPRRGHINVAAGADYNDFVLATAGTVIKDRNDLDHKLTLKGWGAAPFVSFSGDRFGVGFAAEGGRKSTEYLFRYQYGTNPAYRSSEKGTMDYSGVGIYGYFMPVFRFLPRYVITNFVLGGKQLYVVHQTRREATSQRSHSVKYRYGVRRYDVGLDVGLEPVQRFTILPWVNLTLLSPDAARDATDNYDTAKTDPILEADREFLWATLPRLTYGVDFAVNVFRTDVHLGGFLGLVGNLFKGSDRMSDRSLNLSISFEIK